MTETRDALVVVSYYDRRPLSHLHRLLRTLGEHQAGGAFSVCVVVNSTREEQIALPTTSFPLGVLYRENLGMNIGAWNFGWRANPGHPDYLFLEDESYAVREDWLAAFRAKAAAATCGMVGESLNPSWDAPWNELRAFHSGSALADHLIDGRPANRVDFYLDYLQRNAIPAGESGRHLRSRIWFFRSDILERIGGFPVGLNYGECIGAEIGVSKMVEHLGLDLTEVGPASFQYFRTFEYNQDCPGAPFSHRRLRTPRRHVMTLSRDEVDSQALELAVILQETQKRYTAMLADTPDAQVLHVAALEKKLQDRESEISDLRQRCLKLEKKIINWRELSKNMKEATKNLMGIKKTEEEDSNAVAEAQTESGS